MRVLLPEPRVAPPRRFCYIAAVVACLPSSALLIAVVLAVAGFRGPFPIRVVDLPLFWQALAVIPFPVVAIVVAVREYRRCLPIGQVDRRLIGLAAVSASLALASLAATLIPIR